jgi:hypothetical protein
MRKRTAKQSIGQRLAFDEFEYQKTFASLLFQSVNHREVRMVE